ncbi:MAG TPA: hypothetical protein VMZ53_25765 [Kofleriaceae bacterium]|nr:hypothetical protein [Kofleriaceae bacterium]
MSDKKAGNRDISDLKARLGLKKGGAAAPAAAPRANGAPSGGVLAPPGMAVPPPPGAVSPAQPVIPNAADDPFAAMNAMAAVAQAKPQKEYIIVNDGKPVENVGEKSNAASLLKILVPGLIALVIGVAVGKIGTSASDYNEGLRGAKAILGEKTTPSTVKSLKSTLNEIDAVLDEAKTKNGLKPNLDLDKRLKELAAKLEVKLDVVFRAQQVNPVLSGQIMSFYAGVTEVKDMIDIHNKSAAFDDVMLKKGKESADKAASDVQGFEGETKYAVLVSAPTDEDKNAEFGAKVVEIMGVYCGGNNMVSKCGEGEYPNAIGYRTDVGGPVIKGDLAQGGSDNVPTKKVVKILSGTVKDGLIKGGEPAVSEVYYTKRLKALYDRIHGKPDQTGKPVGGLIEDGNKLEQALSTEANKGTRFSFFM